MADTNTTTSGGVEATLATYLVRKAMPVLHARVGILYDSANKVKLPKMAGATTVRWMAWSNFSPASVTLSEGAANSLVAASARSIEATLAQYGRGHKVTDLAIELSSLDAIEGIAAELTVSAAQTVDRVIQTGIFKNDLAANGSGTAVKILSAWMSATVSAFHAGTSSTDSDEPWGFPAVFGTTAARLSAVSKTAVSVSAQLSLYSIRKVVRELRNKNAMPYADGFFKAVFQSRAIQDLTKDPDYKNWLQYSGSRVEHMIKAEPPPIEGVRIYVNNNLPYYRAAAHSCHLGFIWGQGAVGCTYLGPNSGYEIIIKTPNKYDSNNPFNQWTTMTYKITMAAVGLNVSCGRVLLVHEAT